MRILLLADSTSAHTQKWVTALAEAHITVGLFTLTTPVAEGYLAQLPQVCVYEGLALGGSKALFLGNLLPKLAYLRVLPALRRAIRHFAPDIVHAHYASSYGLLGALTGFSPYLISVWGSDVFDFPHQFWGNPWVLRFNFWRATAIASTSNVMALTTKKYTNKSIFVTPFGIDTAVFKPTRAVQIAAPIDHANAAPCVIGTIKTMDDKYGIDYLIRAFAAVCSQYSAQPLQLLLVGGGPRTADYKALAHQLNIAEKVIFEGFVPFAEIPAYHNR